jgi:hypothetical protein
MIEQSASLKPVYVTTTTCGVLAAVYGIAGLRPSALPLLFINLAPLVSVVLWLQNDARIRRVSTVHDWGLLAYLFWPVLVPWYVLRTRGRRAWAMAVWLIGAVVAPLVLLAMAAFWHRVFFGPLH